MIIKANKQIGFIYKNNESIDKILKDGDVVFEKGFLREKTSTTLPITFGGVGKDLKDYRVYGNTVQNGTPTPDAPIDVVSCGDRTKNLFDLSKVSEYTAASGIQISVVQENVKVKGTNSSSSAVGVYLNSADNYYSLKAGKTYVAKYITGQSASASTYRLDIRPTSSTGTILAYETGENGLLYTPTEDINIRFYVRIPANGTVDLSGKIIFEESDTLHDYEPYGYKILVNVNNVITNIYLDEPLRKIGEYSDYIDFANGKVVRNIDEIVLNGSESWTNSAISDDVLVHRFRTLGEKAHVVDIGFSDKFIIRTSDIDIRSDIELVQFSSSSSNKYIGLKIKKSRLTTDDVAGLTTWLSSNNVILNYVLLNFEETSITLPNIPTVDGNNTLNIETEITPSQVYIKYKSST